MKKLFKLCFLSIIMVGLCSGAYAQKTVTGTVTDERGEEIIGAGVMVKGTTNGTVSDISGKFSINVPEKGILVISYIGYQTQEIPIGNETNLQIRLKENVEQLDEVVVVGYGTIRRSDLTGSVGSVSMPAITASAHTNALGGMTGMVSGVSLVRNNNKPGGSYDITIRGLSSISNTNAPLIVIDGVPVPTVSGNGQTGFTSGLETINPDDIEKIDILKDASSTAIYGSRAANGVILVTTKRGQLGKPKISYSGYAGWKTITNMPEMMTGDEWVQLAREAYRAQNNNVYRADAEIFTDPSELKAVQDHNYFDWMDAMVRPALITNHSVQASGGTDAAKYLISGGYYREDGLVKVQPQDFSRYTLRSAVDLKINKYVAVGGDLYLTYALRNTGNSDVLIDVLRLRPTQHPFSLVDESEQWSYSSNGSYNALIAGQNEYNQTKSINMLGNVYLALTPIKGLDLKSSFSPRLLKEMQGQYRGKWTRANRGTNLATSNYRKNDYTDFVWDNIITYKWTDANIHSLDLTGVFSMQQNVMEGLYGLGNSLSFNSLWYNVQGGTTNSSQSSYQQSSLMSYLARANYSLMNRYLFTASVRYDGSSKLAEGNKWGIFPSAAVAWRMSEEAFMQDLSWLSNLKFRLSYGQTGNDAVSPYSSAGAISGSQYVVFGPGTAAVGTVPNRLRNTELTWERTTEYNLGIDVGLFASRLSTNIDLYNRLTTGLIMSAAVPITTGYTSVTDNVGSVRNRGIEVSVNSVNIKTSNFTWTTNLNFAYNKNEIYDLDYKEDLGVYSDQLEGMTGDFSNKWFIGQPIRINWTFEKTGVWQLGEEAEAARYGQKPGQYKVRDYNDDGKHDDMDRFIYGKQTPDWIGGMTNTFQYRDFDFSFNIYFQTGAISNGAFYGSFALEANNQNFNNIKKDYWTPENPTNETAQPSNMGSRRNDASHVFFSTDFLKVGYATLGYTLPSEILKKMSVGQLRLYCTVQNPFTFTNFVGPDPGIPNANINVTDFITRNVIFGINLSF
jgi:TonB-linked SusC/RagA family outer membrane protein